VFFLDFLVRLFEYYMKLNAYFCNSCFGIYGLLLVLSVSLLGCGSAPIAQKTAEAKNKPLVKAAQSAGGYYLDDGPGDNPPANIDAIPSAVPMRQMLLVRANKPYTALGQAYTPMTHYQAYRQQGVASWYGKKYHGQKTASGERYDMYAMTAAHTTLPLISYARVTNPENGKSVIVKINDRGPFLANRLIDLSYAAAYQLRLSQKGSGQVIVEAINADALPFSPASALPTNPTNNQVVMQAKAAQNKPGFYVQVGAFSIKENADNALQQIQTQQLASGTAATSELLSDLYRVKLGPYASVEEANRALVRISNALKTNARIVHQL
jgi:rare lipoprotein A